MRAYKKKKLYSKHEKNLGNGSLSLKIPISILIILPITTTRNSLTHIKTAYTVQVRNLEQMKKSRQQICIYSVQSWRVHVFQAE